jgi:HEAT repeat protein
MATDRARWLSVIERVSADDDALVRVAAAWALGCLKDDLARARLVALARDPSWLVREAAVLGLAAQESRNLVPVLRRALDDPAPLVANAAKVALVRHGAADVGPALLADLADPAVATRTLEALVGLVGKRDLVRDALAAEVERLAGADSRPR